MAVKKELFFKGMSVGTFQTREGLRSTLLFKVNKRIIGSSFFRLIISILSGKPPLIKFSPKVIEGI
jgi:hypothetical protein